MFCLYFHFMLNYLICDVLILKMSSTASIRCREMQVSSKYIFKKKRISVNWATDLTLFIIITFNTYCQLSFQLVGQFLANGTVCFIAKEVMLAD